MPSRIARTQVLTNMGIPPERASISLSCLGVGEKPNKSYSVGSSAGRYSICSVTSWYKSPRIGVFGAIL